MSQQIDAIYVGGVLKPITPLSLPDKSHVIVTVAPSSTPVHPQDEWERQLLALAIDCGVSLPDSALSSDELYE